MYVVVNRVYPLLIMGYGSLARFIISWHYLQGHSNQFYAHANISSTFVENETSRFFGWGKLHAPINKLPFVSLYAGKLFASTSPQVIATNNGNLVMYHLF